MSILKKLRTAANLTQADLAKVAGCTPGHIMHMEKGYRRLTKKWAIRLAPILGVTAQELLFPEQEEIAIEKAVNFTKNYHLTIIAPIANYQWVEDDKPRNLEIFSLDNENEAFKLYDDLKDNIATKGDLAIALPLNKENFLLHLKRENCFIIKEVKEHTNLAKYGIYKITDQTGSEKIELENCLKDTEENSSKITINLGNPEAQPFKIIAKVLYFIRLID